MRSFDAGLLFKDRDMQGSSDLMRNGRILRRACTLSIG